MCFSRWSIHQVVQGTFSCLFRLLSHRIETSLCTHLGEAEQSSSLTCDPDSNPDPVRCLGACLSFTLFR
ncbi:hypothetical protein N665_1555s0001 [Sinapis alba]|nr:hypothetical protein N665_1555s0001 [Sinapis alba]